MYTLHPMTNSLSFKLVAACMLAAVILSFVNVTSAAEPRTKTRTRSGTYQTSKGDSGTFSSTTTRSPGHEESGRTWTNQNGGTGTRQSEKTWDKSTGTGTFSETTTRPDGKTTSREGTTTKTGDHTFQSQGTFTRADGKTGTVQSTTTKTDAGRETQGTITGPNGKQSTFTTEVTHSPGETNRSTVVTGPNGKTSERVVDTHLNGDGTGIRTIEVTKPDGTTESRTEAFTVTKG